MKKIKLLPRHKHVLEYKKLAPIKWKILIEELSFEDFHYEHCYSIKSPGPGWRPVNEKYFKQKNRWRIEKDEYRKELYSYDY